MLETARLPYCGSGPVLPVLLPARGPETLCAVDNTLREDHLWNCPRERENSPVRLARPFLHWLAAKSVGVMFFIVALIGLGRWLLRGPRHSNEEFLFAEPRFGLGSLPLEHGLPSPRSPAGGAVQPVG